ncbi:hypothetical protein OMP38_29945 [Cohnella ginsengisoli]|uniref:Uncharacterized protein n=1 Tax=Cohnella ginsengisoli TaxID=425004 RepID=A0A9X4KM18_9BACL|nr:hypothetical protein [Cohnella ginsengisoli]MDG0794593.1 hypothetical protein [Cohnella ginsengisoli]
MELPGSVKRPLNNLKTNTIFYSSWIMIQKKWGTKFFEKEIKSPKDPAIAKDVPIYITSTYYKQIVEQLLQLNFVNIYIVYDLYDVFIVSKYSGESSDVVSNIQESFNRSFHIVPKENLNVRRYESKLEFDSSKQRVFMISDYYYQPGIGGPVTVMYKLFHANEEYKLVDNLFMLCGNLLMSPRKAELYNKTENKTLEKEPRFFDDYPFFEYGSGFS